MYSLIVKSRERWFDVSYTGSILRSINTKNDPYSGADSGMLNNTLPARSQNFVVERSVNSAALRNPHNYYLPMDVSSRFGVRLRQLRQQNNLTQSRMAADFGIDRTFISDVERGRKSISLPLLEVIALGLHMSLSELLRDI